MKPHTMRLYVHPFSSNARRAQLTAIHLDAPVEHVVVDLRKGEQRKPEFTKLNPNGRVPVLEDGDFVLTESHAIMQYLAEKTPGQTLYPSELRARADVNRWLFWSAHHFAPTIALLAWENMIKKMVGAGDPAPQVIARAEQMLTEHARVLDAHLETREWVAQDKLTLADFALATPLMAIAQAKLPITSSNSPNVMAWLGRVEQLDAWKKTSL